MSDTPRTDDLARGNHVVPTEFAKDLERELNESRDDAEHWKIEYEIVESRLRGVKHKRDNGIIAEHEIIPKLQRERDEAREALDCLLSVIGLTPIAGNREALQDAVDQGLVVLRKWEETK